MLSAKIAAYCSLQHTYHCNKALRSARRRGPRIYRTIFIVSREHDTPCSTILRCTTDTDLIFLPEFFGAGIR